MKPTIKSIAELAGVSVGTVDRVLHGRPKVSEENRRRIEKAIDQLGYKPNVAARTLALHHKGVKIGVVEQKWGPFFRSELRRGIEDAKKDLASYGVEIVQRRCETIDPGESVAHIKELARKEGVRAMAVCAKNVKPVIDALSTVVRDGIPVVTFNSDVPECGRLCHVGQDEYASGRIAGDLLAKILPSGARTLTVVHNLEFASQTDRLNGFRARMAELGRDVSNDPLVYSSNDYQKTYDGVLRILQSDRSVSGLYLASESTSGGVAAIRKLGGTGYIRVVCHDVPDTTLALLREGAVDFAVDQNMYYQGFKPVSILTKYLMAGEKPESVMDYTMVRIVTAETVGFA
ncbi:MAG: LacI family DNA-binding transcriptional regulator [Planctomycetes bacterium]|nr:LacI family DNA-binding transcriptional regulator [Planctomycetota bacterium]